MYSKVALFASITLTASGQSSFSSETKAVWDAVKGNIVKSAERMPEDNYSFRPTPEVRSFGQILGHVADSYFLFCSAVKGEQHRRQLEVVAEWKKQGGEPGGADRQKCPRHDDAVRWQR